MNPDYNDRLSYVKKCMEKKNKLNIMLKQTEQDLIKEKLLLNKLSEELEKENEDVLKSLTTPSVVMAPNPFAGMSTVATPKVFWAMSWFDDVDNLIKELAPSAELI